MVLCELHDPNAILSELNFGQIRRSVHNGKFDVSSERHI